MAENTQASSKCMESRKRAEYMVQHAWEFRRRGEHIVQRAWDDHRREAFTAGEDNQYDRYYRLFAKVV